ncbi:hypothetical protein, partial [Pantoea sp. CTOTU46764]|uniref:hypothetical protein n=1 Tax=Pantoea sp. CTOTU46764 TaxID=2953854 RepID=UPI002899C648
ARSTPKYVLPDNWQDGIYAELVKLCGMCRNVVQNDGNDYHLSLDSRYHSGPAWLSSRVRITALASIR